MQTIIFKQKDYAQVAPLFLMEGVVAIPTETVMGLGVLARSYNAYKALIDVKNRPLNKAFPLVVGNKQMIHSYGIIDARQQRIIDEFMPGPLTIIVKKQSNVMDYVTANSDKIAIRMSDCEFVNNLLSELKEPILLTSANLAGEPSLLDSEAVKEVFYGKIRGIVEGEASIGTASTIVDISGEEPIVVREGVINLEQIKKVWEGK